MFMYNHFHHIKHSKAIIINFDCSVGVSKASQHKSNCGVLQTFTGQHNLIRCINYIISHCSVGVSEAMQWQLHVFL
jgi:hypothetical protein